MRMQTSLCRTPDAPGAPSALQTLHPPKRHPLHGLPPLDALAMMAIELREVCLELGQLRKELAAARQENDQLRRQLGSGRTPPITT